MPASSSARVTRSAPCLVRVKTRTRVSSASSNNSTKQVALLRRFDVQHALLDSVGGLGGGRHRHLNGIAQQFAGERADIGRHRRRKEQVLPLPGQFPHDAADRLDEAEVEHLVDLVEHQKFDHIEMRDAGVEMIEEPAGRCDEHVEARLKRTNLRAMRHAAEYDRDLEPQARRTGRGSFARSGLRASRVGTQARARARRLSAPGACRSRAC